MSGNPADLPGPLTVSEVTSRVRAALESALPFLWVEGEISELSRPASGHIYLSLADERSQLSCVMFRSYAHQLRFDPEPGMKVLAYGNLSVYERGGRYQFYLYRMRPSGVGEMALAFEELRARLAEEGLFDEGRKRPLPAHPRAVGIVTSPTGAAVRDVVQVLGRRAPGVPVVLAPARVQGAGSPGEIAAAIDRLNRFGGVDVVVVTRGGGSPEDLWPFNDEGVARAIHGSALPVVTAVGHEIDHTIADYVADVRASTPSVAAELVTRERALLGERLADRRGRLLRAVRDRLDRHQRRLDGIPPGRLAAGLGGRVDQRDQDLDESLSRLAAALDGGLCSRRERFDRSLLRLDARNPLRSLAGGFAYCQRERDGRRVRSAAELHPGERLRLRFADGAARCQVEEVESE